MSKACSYRQCFANRSSSPTLYSGYPLAVCNLSKHVSAIARSGAPNPRRVLKCLKKQSRNLSVTHTHAQCDASVGEEAALGGFPEDAYRGGRHNREAPRRVEVRLVLAVLFVLLNLVLFVAESHTKGGIGEGWGEIRKEGSCNQSLLHDAANQPKTSHTHTQYHTSLNQPTSWCIMS